MESKLLLILGLVLLLSAAWGETVAVEPLRLGPPLPTRTISGRLTRADGQPLGRGTVTIHRPGAETVVEVWEDDVTVDLVLELAR